MITKHKLNPILTAQTDLSWANKKVYNAAAVLINNDYHLFFRAIGQDYVSRIGHASGKDGANFKVESEPVFMPLEKWEVKGCEDPRITKIEEKYVMAYTAYDGLTARVAMANTVDFVTWSPRIVVFPDWREGRWVDPDQQTWNKAAAVLPEKINGKYYLLFGDDNIWQAYSDDLVNWTPIIQPVLEPREGRFDSSYIEMGPPPILTDRGWLIIYHGIDGRDSNRVYRLGAAIVEYDNPSKVIWRCKEPILEPTELFERIGQIDIIEGGMERLRSINQKELVSLSEKSQLPQAIFCCGAIEHNGKINIYYSGSDTVLCLATCTIADILKH